MSSREIADLCEARHNDVVATIKRLDDKGVLRLQSKTPRKYYPDGDRGGRPTEVYDLTKRDALIIVSGYDAGVRAKLIDRWIELETKALEKISPNTSFPISCSDMLDRLKAREHATPLKPGIYGGVISFAELDTLDGKHVISVVIDLIAGRQIYDNIFVTTRSGHDALKAIGAPNGKVIGDTSDMTGCVVAVRLSIHTDKDRFNFVRNYEDPNFVLENDSKSSSKKRPVAPPSIRKEATVIPMKPTI